MARLFEKAIVTALLIATAVAGRPALAMDPACKPVLDAMAKQAATPSHLHMTQVAAFRGGKPMTGESIYTGNVLYIQVRGTWRRSPVSVQDMTKQREESTRNAKSMACRYLRDETVGGEAAAVYRSQAEIEDAKSDSTLWVSKRTGLPLRSESDIDTGASWARSTRRSATHYADVRPPAGVK